MIARQRDPRHHIHEPARMQRDDQYRGTDIAGLVRARDVQLGSSPDGDQNLSEHVRIPDRRGQRTGQSQYRSDIADNSSDSQ
ncbi:hypothetical protein [Nocardia acidivorans]|uniref:hypothetical protein n=1 Tax=Nocardia acidivorans TaxID=404580 RepID=UPI00147104D4|nr:hypothetical protein [Nocardia acidivorans]